MKTAKLPLWIFTAIILVGCSPQSTSVKSATDTSTIEQNQTITATIGSDQIITLTPTNTLVSSTLPVFTKTPINPPAIADCTQGWTKLTIGRFAKVAGEAEDPPNRVRSEPKKGDNTIAQIYPGAIVKIIEGPVCSDGMVFWKVENNEIPDGIGWTAEGDFLEYWIMPYAYIPDSVQLKSFGVSITVPGSWSSVPDSKIVTQGSDWMCSWPQHIIIQLTSYPAKSEWFPTIYVSRIADMPDWYPICPGAPLLIVQKRDLSQGYRNLFESTNAKPIFNSQLTYGYYGNSSDGTYAIFAFFPVNYPYLAWSFKDLTLPPGGIPFDLNNSDWASYYSAVGGQLNAASSEDFTPTLSLLDTIVESITIQSP